MQVTFTGRGLEITEAMKDFITEKLEKIPYIESATHINCEIGQEIAHKGTEKDFYIRLLITLPKAAVRMKKEGPEVYSLLDEMLPSIQKKLVQYKENSKKWEGSEQWPEAKVEEEQVDTSVSAVYANYVPKIKRKNITEMQPMSVSEAIERMELLDKSFFVFKDILTNSIAVVSKKGGSYELIST